MINQFIKTFVTWHAKRVETSFMQPKKTQEQTFLRLKQVLRQAKFAKTTGFTSCNSLEDLKRLPISDSKTLKPLFEEIKKHGNAKRKLFGSSKLLMFARTSGTTATPKDIPINKAYIKALDRSLVRVVASYLYTTKSWSTFLKGKQIILASRPYIEHSCTGLPIVDISGLIPTRTWWAFRWMYIPKFKDLWHPDWNERLNCTVEQSVNQNVTAISGIPALAKAFINQAQEENKGAYLDEFWPNLRFYTYGAVPLSKEAKLQLRKQWFSTAEKHEFYFIEAYFATEACIAHSFNPQSEGLVLNLLEYLFIFKKPDSDEPSLLAHELKAGETYLLFITTPGGLINYAMHDKIKVISEKPLLIKFVGRENEEISLTGEKITLEQLRLAVSDLKLANQTFIVWPEESEGKARLAWGFPEAEIGSSIEALASSLDASLSTYNTLYNEALNIENVIQSSRIYLIPKDVLEAYTQANLGIGQYKAKVIFSSKEEWQDTLHWNLPLR